MDRRKRHFLTMGAVLALASLAWGVGPAFSQFDPGGIPHYFGPYGNWAYSPLPRGPVAVVTLVDGGTGYTAPVVTIEDVYGTGAGASPAAATIDPITGAITGITGGLGGSNYSAPIVTITDPTGTGATATATIGGILTGGIHKFVDRVPGLGPANANNIVQAHGAGQYIPVAVFDNTTYLGSDYYEIALVQYSEKMHTDLPPTRQRGYVQLETPGTLAAIATRGLPPSKHVPVGGGFFAIDNPHFLGPAIVATSNRPVRVTFRNLLPTGAGGDLFLPVDTTIMGAGMGPKDASGAACDPMMPPMPGMPACESYKQNRAAVHLHGNNTVWISDGTPHQWITPAGETTPYPKGVSAQNVPDMPDPGPGAMTLFYTNAMSARLMFYHDHAMGITRLNVYAGEAAGYVVTDPIDQDMINGTNVSGVNPGLLKVLPDIGIPLIIQDRTFVDASTIWTQDPTWNWGTGPRVSGKITSAVTGDLWTPHVYMTAQNPWDLTGTNPFGRWHYGPWFWPPTPECDASGLPVGCIAVGPVPNEYYQPVCDVNPADPGCTMPWEPPMRPGTPNPSMPGEAFNDTPIVNGTVYPYLEVEPKAYRFRILNAANDRFFNLQLYVAADKTTPTTPDNTVVPRWCDTPPSLGGVTYDKCTEVKMVPVGGFPNQQADWPSGLPDPATKGPNWIQIGTEGGFLPAPAVIPIQPIGWNLNPTTFNYGNVNQHSLLLGTAERADVVVDFSAFNGKTLILYNDAPAAFPAGVPSYDFYTGTPDQMDTGGAPTTQPGYGPNTRTVMQIRVNKPLTTPTTGVTLANLRAVFAKTAAKRGVFEASQDPIIVPQAAYNSAYNRTFPSTARAQYVNFVEKTKKVQTINPSGAYVDNVTFPLQPKAMHDEMGGVYDTGYGRMSGMLGLTDPTPSSTAAPFLAYGYASPPTDINIQAVSGTPIDNVGTQIWKITHNGVDTHTIHVHLFNAQLINRVAMDGIMLPPDPNELGWKDTFRVNPLEHTIIAMRPVVPTPAQVPFTVPNSVRLIDPTLPEGAPLIPPPPAGWSDPAGNAIAEILNHYVNFGWEYVWHCHILAHEEMDMMHSLVFAVAPEAPSALVANRVGIGLARHVDLTWNDNSRNEISFTVQRATASTGPWAFLATVPSILTGPTTGARTYTDPIGNTDQAFWYRVFASNLVGDNTVYPGSTNGFPTVSLDSPVSNTATWSSAVPAAPTNLTATILSATQIRLDWTDNSNNETGFAIWRSINAGPFTQITTVGANVVTFTNGALAAGNTYSYYVTAVNAAGPSAPSNTVTVLLSVSTLPAAPTGLTVRVAALNPPSVALAWVDNANNETGFTIQRATNGTFTANLTTFTVAANVTTFNDTTVVAGQTQQYWYRVRAFNGGGNSAFSNIVNLFVRPQFVRVAASTPQTPTTTVTVPFVGAQTAGNLNIVVVGWNDTTRTVVSVTDSRGNPYSLAIGPTSGIGLRQSIYYASNILAGTNTVTVTFSGPANFPDIRVLEYSGVTTLDRTAGASGTGINITSGTATTTAANELIFGANTVSTGVLAPGTDFTTRIITVPDQDSAEDRNVFAIGAYSATATIAQGNWVMQMATFK